MGVGEDRSQVMRVKTKTGKFETAGMIKEVGNTGDGGGQDIRQKLEGKEGPRGWQRGGCSGMEEGGWERVRKEEEGN